MFRGRPAEFAVPLADALEGSRFHLADELASDERFRLYRGQRDGESHSVLLKVATAPTAVDRAALKREFDLLNSVTDAAVVRALAFADGEREAVLVLEDRGDAPLAIPRSPLPLGWVLDYATQLVAALAAVHRAGIVHLGVHPRAVLVHPHTGRIRLCDFVLAARDAAEAAAPLTPRQYRARLAYAAPEQTGRINRACDYRTDFYSLGAVMYELLTGRTPFVSDDPLELIHGHVARLPPAPSDVVPSLPLPVSQIVMKLLAKPAEERYQSSSCLAQDLDRCRREWSGRGRIMQFPIAERDVSERFSVPQRLYGRAHELAQLAAAFHEARRGPATLLLVAGYAGIGKTALIQELREPVAHARGAFVSGKFDQLSRNVPYGALVQALRQLVQHLLAADPAELAQLRSRLGDALGVHTAVITEVIPEIEMILGPQRPAPWLPPAEAHNRFMRAFENFVGALASANAPLVIFLDDLQWVDAATLHLLSALLASPQVRHLLLIGAYRDNETQTDHPLMNAASALEANGVPVRRIALPPLPPAALIELTADTLHVPRARAEPLARLLQDKTNGNPFFLIQFLLALHRDGVIVFDPERATWTYRLEAIANAQITDNVVDLMRHKIGRLAPDTQRAMTLAACIGNRFDAETLAAVSRQSPADTMAQLAAASAEGLIVPEGGGVFVFLHDRVQQAAYARIADFERPQAHLAIGRRLWNDYMHGAAQAGAFDRLFDTASHLNLGAALMETATERLALAQLNLAAGSKAKSSAAYGAALGYFSAGAGLLDEGHWSSHYELAFALGLEAAQCEYLCGRFEQALQQFDRLLERARADLDRASVYRLRLVQFENMSRYADAVTSARAGLRLFGVALPESNEEKQATLAGEIDRIGTLLGTRAIESLIELPVMTDPAMRMVMRILTDIWSSTYILGDAVLSRLISATLVRLSLVHGNAEESAYGYVTHAITAGPVHEDYKSAWSWGALALRVNERFGDTRLRAKIYQQFHAHVNLWRRPFLSCIAYAKEARRSGLESGDLVYAGYAAMSESWVAFAAAQSLDAFTRDFGTNVDLLTRLKYASLADVVRMMIGWAQALQGRTDAAFSLSDASFSEERYVETYRGNPFFSMFHAIARLHLHYTLDDFDGALRVAASVRHTTNQLTGMIWSPLFRFWNGLAIAATLHNADGLARDEGRTELQNAAHALAVLADNCRENFRCHALLLEAETARVDNRAMVALERYEQAIAVADECDFVQHQALANELFGRFWLERGNRTIAAVYLHAARDHYARWGAQAKVRSLTAQHGALLAARPHLGSELAANDAVRPVGETLDLATIGKAAHAITVNVELEPFLSQMLELAIENAGASSGVLIEDRDGGFFVAAEGRADRSEIVLSSDRPLEAEPAPCSRAIVNYVSRTGTTLVLGDPVLDERFAQDGYLANVRPKSILCLPIVHQGRLSAILYLENRFARDAFSADRIEVIQILAAQVAISLDSARLLHRMQVETAERRRAEQQLRVIETGTSTVTGGDFFRALVKNLALALDVRYAFAAECCGTNQAGHKIVRSRAFWCSDRFGPDFEYEVPGTPCQEVLEGETCHHAANLQERFPADRALVDMGAQSYFGMPLVGTAGEVIGHLAILDTEPMPDATVAMSVMRLSAGRAGAELERLKAEEGLQHALAEVEELKNRLQAENIYLRRELIANVSHDLRSPLASLRGYLDTLLIKERTLTPDERHNYVTIAVRQAEHLQSLISELFDLARLDFQGYRINPELLHLGELASDVLQKFQLAAKEREIDLQLGVSGDVGFVNADIGLIERTLENLIENALAHTPPHGLIELSLAAQDGAVTIRVSDTGSGIPAADLPHIFERFYRVDKARTREASGSGLGLAIVKRIVELHASEIKVESTPESGTTFWFALRTVPDATTS